MFFGAQTMCLYESTSSAAVLDAFGRPLLELLDHLGRPDERFDFGL